MKTIITCSPTWHSTKKLESYRGRQIILCLLTAGVTVGGTHLTLEDYYLKKQIS